MRNRNLLLLLACFATLAVFGGVLLVAQATSARAGDVQWSAPTADFTADDQQSLEARLAQALAAASVPGGGPQPAYSISGARRSEDFAVLMVVTHDAASGQVLDSEPFYVIARRQHGVWSIWLPTSPGFCAQFRALPAGMLSVEERAMLSGCSA